jgi:hypothetical protein
VSKAPPTRSAAISDEFEIEGEFRGFFRDLLGKHRMALQCESEESYLKVPKRLRKVLRGALAPGQRIVARGVVKLDRETGEQLHVLVQVRLSNGALLACPIRVCVKKNCWRKGGKQLWHALKEGIAEADLEDEVRLKGVNCLGHCEHGPNAECAGRLFHHCTPSDAEKILESFLT